MKRLILIGLALLTACTSEYTITTKTFNLKGNVKTIRDRQVECYCDNKNQPTPDSTKTGMSFISVYSFDEEGIWVSGQIGLANGTIYSNTEVLFDEDGNYAGTKVTGEDGEIISKDSVTEISENRIKMESKTANGNLFSKSTSDYENHLVKKQKTEWTDGSLTIEQTFKRDKEGNEEEMEVKRSEQGVTTEEIIKIKCLEKDSNGNWTKQLYYREKSNKCTVLERTIEYY